MSTLKNIEAIDELTRAMKTQNYLNCLKELHNMLFIDDIEYKDRMRSVLKANGMICNEKFWDRGITD